ncbi:sigma-70 family RNA polymerase sigma factor [Oculatella sp. LEGE 06141]|uniref:sigma-70 family RNA polymerase sigma factor n=1 Tax=Oculatella sp. LEGE 06141 TaxID=1828648 RepID=UPI00187F7566|nr:sigma-70 family RNA polymerase sigma factor [Oculatella sp. LEGE 06141]MBE9178970.1 sigma-70 family RNA polymerase sigma factor [Oculatella sp. LEGE 06141]
MASKFQLRFDSEHPDIDSFKAFIQRSLELYQLAEICNVDDILDKACSRNEGWLTADSVVEIHLAWLKTTCLEVIEELNRQRDNKRKFDIAIQALFDIENPDARSLLASVTRTLRQHRLYGTYEVKEIMAEAYAIGIRRIELGTIIEKPLPWLRSTCLNVIRDLRRKQDKLDKPKLDGEGFSPGDEVFSDLIFAEDRKAMRLALEQLSYDDRQILHARVLKHQAWQEIGEALSNPNEAALNANAARQRGYRALQKLRQLYDAIRQNVQIDDDEPDERGRSF